MDGRVSFGYSLMRGKRASMEDFYFAQVDSSASNIYDARVRNPGPLSANGLPKLSTSFSGVIETRRDMEVPSLHWDA